MPHGVNESPAGTTGNQTRNVGRHDDDQRRNMLVGFQRHELVSYRDGISATRVGVRRGSALPLQAASRFIAARSTSSEAFKRPEKQGHGHQANRDAKTTSHLVQVSM